MSAGDVAKFVGDNALHLLDIIGGADQARMDVDRLPLHDEGVDRWVADQHHFYRFGIKTRGDGERTRHIVEQRLGFGVAQDRLRRCRADGKRGDEKRRQDQARSEEHTSELQSLMRISYAVFSLKKIIHYNTT